jgi:hypothetical protein
LNVFTVSEFSDWSHGFGMNSGDKGYSRSQVTTYCKVQYRSGGVTPECQGVNCGLMSD